MRKKYILSLLAAAVIFMGSGCSSSDADLVIDFINEWARSRGILDEKGNPTGQAILYGATGMSTGDKQADAAIDAGLVVKSIKDADEKSKAAQEALDKNPPDRDAALQNLTDAVDSRPKDWYLRSQKGVVLLEMGQTAEAGEYLVTNNNDCNPDANLSQARQERCFRQLQDEVNAMASANERMDRTGEKRRCDLLRAQAEANNRLAALASDPHYPQTLIASNRLIEEDLRTNNCK